MTRWTEQIGRRLKGEESNIPWWVNDKFKLYNFCVENGVPIPEMLSVWRRPEEVDLSNAPDEFVLKPSVMHSAWGVMLLSRAPGEDVYFEALSSRTLTEEAIKREQVGVYEQCKYKGEYRIFVEERVSGPQPDLPIPLDYKFFTFYDKVEMIQQIDRNVSPARVAWFDGEFRPMDLERNIQVDYAAIDEGGHAVPADAQTMLDVASRVTTLLQTPFMRVDMFTSVNGPVVGELTPAPGGAYYGHWFKLTDRYDEQLGAAWEDAAARMPGRDS